MLEAADRREERRVRELAWIVLHLTPNVAKGQSASEIHAALVEELAGYEQAEAWNERASRERLRRERSRLTHGEE